MTRVQGSERANKRADREQHLSSQRFIRANFRLSHKLLWTLKDGRLCRRHEMVPNCWSMLATLPTTNALLLMSWLNCNLFPKQGMKWWPDLQGLDQPFVKDSHPTFFNLIQISHISDVLEKSPLDLSVPYEAKEQCRVFVACMMPMLIWWEALKIDRSNIFSLLQL